MAQDCYEAVEDGRIQLTRAITICDTALDIEQLRPKDRAATFTNRGILYMRQGDNTRAIADYRKSIDLMPTLLHDAGLTVPEGVQGGNLYEGSERQAAVIDIDHAQGATVQDLRIEAAALGVKMTYFFETL